jgi:sulfopyruvate decarboxylase subunit beta
MNLGTLATIANHAPDNYLLIILDNCCYGSTGSQPTCTSQRTDLALVARAAGVQQVRTVTTPDGLFDALSSRGVVVARVEPGNADVPLIDITPEHIIERFMGSLLPAGPFKI